MNALAVAKMRAYIRSALLFVREQFQVEPDEWQADMLEAFCAVDASGQAKFRRMLALACKGPGKTALLAWLGWYFLATRPHCKVPCASITGANLKDGLWAEFAKWQKRSPFLMAAFTWHAERIVNNEHPETWWASKRSWEPDADPTQQANSIAGLHEDYLLWLLDEASDMPDGVVSAAEGALSGGKETRLVMMGNATRTDGPMWRACGVDRKHWHCTRITGDPDDPKRSSRINLAEAQAMIEKYGRHSLVVKVNILGEFPDRAADKLIDMRDCDAAMLRTVAAAIFEHMPKIIGVDVARMGDDSTIFAPRQGRMCFQMKEFRELDNVQVAEQLMLSITKWNADAAFVDIGGGAGVADVCRSRGFGHLVHLVNFGSRADEETRFENKRVEMYWSTAEWLKGGGCLPKDMLLATELASASYWPDKRDRTCLEPKDDIKARLGRSPDRADALVLTFGGTVNPKPRPMGAHGPVDLRMSHTAVHKYDPLNRGA